jgi:hypothetical protein
MEMGPAALQWAERLAEVAAAATATWCWVRTTAETTSRHRRMRVLDGGLTCLDLHPQSSMRRRPFQPGMRGGKRWRERTGRLRQHGAKAHGLVALTGLIALLMMFAVFAEPVLAHSLMMST